MILAGIYITLSSNANLDVLKYNISYSYHMDLVQHIDLKGPRQVALDEISYPHTWFNILPELAYFQWRKNPKT